MLLLLQSARQITPLSAPPQIDAVARRKVEDDDELFLAVWFTWIARVYNRGDDE